MENFRNELSLVLENKNEKYKKVKQKAAKLKQKWEAEKQIFENQIRDIKQKLETSSQLKLQKD